MYMLRVGSRTSAPGRPHCRLRAMVQPRPLGRRSLAGLQSLRMACSEAAAVETAPTMRVMPPSGVNRERQKASKSQSCCNRQAWLRTPRFQFATGQKISGDAISWGSLAQGDPLQRLHHRSGTSRCSAVHVLDAPHDSAHGEVAGIWQPKAESRHGRSG